TVRLSPTDHFPAFPSRAPLAHIVSSRCTPDSARPVFPHPRPTLPLFYLPHLDYNLQRLGPRDPKLAGDLRAVDAICGELIEMARKDGAAVIVLSEYGITEVTDAVHVNRALREAGFLRVRVEMGRELLEAGASDAFAVADHQVAHVYVAQAGRVAEVKALLERLPGVERVIDEVGKRELGLDHPRSGELVAISRPDRWFSYYYWLDDDLAPDFARTVDIHRKPGYDPAELFLDPRLPLPKLKIGWTLAKKALGFRSLLQVIPLDTSLVRGSHGRPTHQSEDGPVFLDSEPGLLPAGEVTAVDVKRLVLDHVFAH